MEELLSRKVMLIVKENLYMLTLRARTALFFKKGAISFAALMCSSKLVHLDSKYLSYFI